MAWTGFSDEQLHQLKRQASNEDSKPARGRSQNQHPQRGRGRPQGPGRGRGRAGQAQSGQRQEAVSQDQMLSRPKPKGKPVSSAEREVWSALKEPTERRPPPARRKAQPAAESDGDRKQGEEEKGSKVRAEEEEAEMEKDAAVKEGEEPKEEMKILDENEGQVRELSKMAEFQKKQKEMEEDNARKKSLLAKAIADRKKKTVAEARRLEYIQKELAKIESLLTNDVSILRDKIETTSRDFLDAQRRYEKAEAEFVAAKIHLHKTSELKEALTEHLFTIIHENEIRKANKLEELVSKLDVENLSEFENVPEHTKPMTPTTPTSPTTSPVQSAPPQTTIPDHPSEINGVVQPSATVTQETQPDRGNSTVNTGEQTSTVNEQPSQNITEITTVNENEKGNNEINTFHMADKSSSKSDTYSSNEKESSSANEQPEAEQHVEVNTSQT